MNSRSIHYLLAALVLLGAFSLLFAVTTQADEWKSGRISAIGTRSIQVEGWTYYFTASTVVKDIHNNILPADPKVLRGVEEVLFRVRGYDLVEVKIFRQRD